MDGAITAMAKQPMRSLFMPGTHLQWTGTTIMLPTSLVRYIDNLAYAKVLMSLLFILLIGTLERFGS